MGKKSHSLVMFIPHASRHFPIIRRIMKSIRAEFSPEEMPEMRIDGWVIKDRMGVILVFRKKSPIRGLLKELDLLIKDLNIRVYEMDEMLPSHRKAVMETFEETSPEIGFRGEYDLEQALDEIDGRFLDHHKHREQWYSDRIPVGLKALL